MLRTLIQTAMNARLLVLALSLALLFFGINAAKKAPMDVFPEFAPIKVEIQTEAPGLSTEAVEQLISIPLEQALNGTPQLKTLRSKSVLGLSSVVLLFEEGTDLFKARQYVQERLSLAASKLPAIAKPPVMLPPLSSLSRLLKIGVASDALSKIDLSSLVMWTVRPNLMSVPGVANVAVWGQRDKQLQIQIDPDQLRAVGITLQQVMLAAGQAVSIESGGFVDSPNQRIALRYADASINPKDLAQTVVSFKNNTPIYLGDVAHVVIGAPPVIGDAVVNNGDGLLLIVEKHPAANTIAVTEAVEAALATLTPALSDVTVDAEIFRPATFITRAIDNLSHALLLGAALVAVILIVFLRNTRAALISLCAIPLSLVSAVLMLTIFNVSLNTMVIAGLVIALGEVVDDAIIDVENILRRLKQNQLLSQPRAKMAVIIDASLEVRSAVVYATFIVMAVFTPVLWLTGIAGAFFKPLALAYLLAIFASLLVALIITPVLCYFLFDQVAEDEEWPLVTKLREGYARLVSRLLVKPARAIMATAALLFITILSSFSLGAEFLPAFKETDFLMHFLERPGASIEQMKKVSLRAANDLLAIPGVNHFGAHIGRAEVADEVVGPNFTELWVSVDTDADYDQTLAAIQQTMDGYAGLYTDVQTYLKERSKEVLSGTSASIVVRLYGADLNVLREQAQQLQQSIQPIEGVADLKVEQQVLVPQIEVRLKPKAAQRYGVTAADIKTVTSTVLKGTKVGQVYQAQQAVDIVVIGQAHTKTDIAAIQALPIQTASGLQLRIKDVADVYMQGMPNVIKREAASRRIDIVANAKGRDLAAVARNVEATVLAHNFPTGYYPEFLGEYTAQKQATHTILLWSLVVLLVIALIVYLDFQSYRLTVIFLASLPFALVGSVLAIILSGGVLSLGSIVGLIAVIGIAARNGILLLSHYDHLIKQEKMQHDIGLVLKGAQERLIPILMTALATTFALLPIIFKGPISGYEIEYPLAVVVVGGLISSTLLNLLVLPAVYFSLGKAKAES